VAVAERVVAVADGLRITPVVDRSGLPAGAQLSGPAIVTQLDATTLIRPGWDLTVDVSAALILRHRVG
jgi:N-methylhydantoinase A